MPEYRIRKPDAPAERSDEPLLEVTDLTVQFRTRTGIVNAVKGLSFSIDQGEVLGVVGESGSGKSVAMYSMMGLIDDPNAKVTGSVRFAGQEVLGLAPRKLNAIRGNRIAMIFQDPMTALTPVYTVGWQIVETLRAHRDISRADAWARAVELLGEAGIPDPEQRARSYPHEFSGGMRQRVMIAMALACDPQLLIADEPTTALDVTTQRQILELMRDLQKKYGSSIIMITHDMGVISEIADDVIVMYSGKAVEAGPKSDVIRTPRHPYTWGLLGAIPRLGDRRGALATIPGLPPAPYDVSSGCAFQARCRFAFDECGAPPALRSTDGADDHLDACWLPGGDRARLRAEVRP